MSTWLSTPELKVALDQRDDRGTFTNDPLLTSCAALACSWVERQAARRFLAADYSRAFVGNGKQEVYVPEWPINSVSRLVIGTSTVTVGTMSQYRQGTASAYYTTCSIRYPRLGFTLDEIVELDWNAGYSATAIPQDIKRLAVAAALIAYKEADRWGDQQKNLATATTIFERKLPPLEQQTLASLRSWAKLYVQPGSDL